MDSSQSGIFGGTIWCPFHGPLVHLGAFVLCIHLLKWAQRSINIWFILESTIIYHIVYQNHYKHLLESQLSTLVFNICHHTQLFLPRVIKLNICPKIFRLFFPLADFFKWQMKLLFHLRTESTMIFKRLFSWSRSLGKLYHSRSLAKKDPVFGHLSIISRGVWYT